MVGGCLFGQVLRAGARSRPRRPCVLLSFFCIPKVPLTLRVLHSCFLLVFPVVALVPLAAGRLLCPPHSGRCPCSPGPDWRPYRIFRATLPLAVAANLTVGVAPHSGGNCCGVPSTWQGLTLLAWLAYLSSSPFTQPHPYGLTSPLADSGE